VFGTSVAKRRVLYFNAEDDGNVLLGRFAANCKRNGISQDEFDDRLILQSGTLWPDLYLIGMNERDIQINEAVFAHMARQVERWGIDVIIFDPLQDLSHADESNEAFRILGQRIRRLASESGVSVGLIHHTRKVAPGLSATIDDARGGSALRGTSRFNRVLVAMSEGEAVNADVDDPRYFFRIGDVESNLAPPSSDKNQWFEKTGSKLPNGENVGALVKWTWPDAFENITVDMAVRVVDELAQLDASQARASSQSPHWFGFIVARICDIDIPTDNNPKTLKSAKSKVGQILAHWEASDFIQVGRFMDGKKTEGVPVYELGRASPRAI
jgi:hypothetical protein